MADLRKSEAAVKTVCRRCPPADDALSAAESLAALSGADIAKIVMRDPQLMRALRQRRKLACDPAQQTHEFNAGQGQQFGL
jgi:hypothetical protein